MLRIMKHASLGKTLLPWDSLRAYLLDVSLRGGSAAKPKNYRKRRITRTGYQERQRHLRQMAASQLDFTASDPIIWRNRPLVPVYLTDTKVVREFGRLERRRLNRDRKRRARHVH